MALTKRDLVADLRRLGVQPGMTLMVHSGLSALGDVEGGANTVIEALIKAIGPTGTLAMPAMSEERPFDVKTSPSTVGVITEAFRNYSGVRRSLHPTHSACALGPKAEGLLEGHIAQPTAVGPESPWGRLARLEEGYVLLLGVDQDRNTFLHYPEETVKAPYLSTTEHKYKDEDGEVRTKVLHHFPGPHRDFIGLDPRFRQAGIMRIGKVRKAVFRLLHAGSAVEVAVEALRQDPAAVLCDNPSCDDCVAQRARLKAHDLAQRDFIAAVLLDELADSIDDTGEGLDAVAREGISHVELGQALSAQMLANPTSLGTVLAGELADREMAASCIHCGLSPEEFMADGQAVDAQIRSAIELAAELQVSLIIVPSPPGGTDVQAAVDRLRTALQLLVESPVKLVFENMPGSCWDTGKACETTLLALADDCPLGFAYNPAHFVNVGEKPFLGTYRSYKLKRYTRIIYVTDDSLSGRPADTLLGQGNGEVKELMSIFACRSFNGFMTLKMGARHGLDAFREHAATFWHLLANH